MSAFRAGRPRTVLFLDSSPKVGGGQVSLLSLLTQIDRARYQPVLATPPGSGPERLAGNMGIETLPLRIASRTARRTGMKSGRFRGWHQEPWRLARAVMDVRGWMRSRDVTLVHANNTLAGIVAVLATHRTRCPVVFHHRLETSLAGAGRIAAGGATRVICVSRASADALSLQDGRVRVIPDGVDIDAFERAAQDAATAPGESSANHGTVVVVIGRLSPEKGQDVFLEAAREVIAVHPATHFILAGEAFLPGDAVFETTLRAVASRAPLDGRVTFTGFHADIPALLAHADLAVVPSRREGLGIAALEAMAAGRAVIASAVGGLRETIVPGETGLLVSPGSARPLAAAIGSLVSDPALRHAMGAAGRKRAREQYSRERMAADIMALYDQVLGG